MVETGEIINQYLPLRYFDKVDSDEQYASTYDCPLSGGITIRIDGLNFGKNSRVFVGGRECPVTDAFRANEVREMW